MNISWLKDHLLTIYWQYSKLDSIKRKKYVNLMNFINKLRIIDRKYIIKIEDILIKVWWVPFNWFWSSIYGQSVSSADVFSWSSSFFSMHLRVYLSVLIPRWYSQSQACKYLWDLAFAMTCSSLVCIHPYNHWSFASSSFYSLCMVLVSLFSCLKMVMA